MGDIACRRCPGASAQPRQCLTEVVHHNERNDTWMSSGVSAGLFVSVDVQPFADGVAGLRAIAVARLDDRGVL